MSKNLEDINNELKSIVNESKFISIKLRNKIIKDLGKRFDINLPVQNFENIDVQITKTGNIIMRDEEYKRESELSLEEVYSRYNEFKEDTDIILKKKEINYSNMNDGKNILNLFITFILSVIYISLIIFCIKSLFDGDYFVLFWILPALSSYFIPNLRQRFDQAFNFIKRKFK